MPYYFNLPVITDLTPDQQRAVDEMFRFKPKCTDLI